MAEIVRVQDVPVNLAYGLHSSGLQVTIPAVAANDTLVLAVNFNGLTVSIAGISSAAGDNWHFSTGNAQNPPTAINGSNVALTAWTDPVTTGGSRTVTVTFSGSSSGWQFSSQGALSEFANIGSEVSGAAIANGAGGIAAIVSPGALNVPPGGLVVGAAIEAFRTIAPYSLTAFSSDTTGASGWAIPGTSVFIPQWSTTNGSEGPTADQGWLAVAAVFAPNNVNTIVVSNPGAQVSIVGTPVVRAMTATDTGSGQTLTWTANGLPPGLSISSSTGTISGTPVTAGTYNVTVTATDTTLSTGFAAWTWTVDAASSGPYGTTLRPIDGGATYFASNGFTQAANAGFDGPSFFPLGIWDALLSSQSDANRWLDLGLNMAWVLNTGSLSLFYPTNPIFLMSVGGNPPSIVATGGYVPGPETVGQLASDEPADMTSWEGPIRAQPDASQDSRWWWTNFTGSHIHYGVQTSPSNPTLIPLSQVLTTTVLSPNNVSRKIDVASADIYWYTGANDSNLVETGGILYGLFRNMLADEAARGCHYGDIVKWLRLAAPALVGGNGASAIPFLLHIEVGGPDTADTSMSNTTVASGSNGGLISNIGSWSSPSAGVLDIGSTTGFDGNGTIFVATSSGVAQVTYTGLTGTTFTGCSYVGGSASGTVATGGLVYQSDYITPAQLHQAIWSAIMQGVRMISYFDNTFAGPAQTDDSLANAFFQTVQPGQSISIYNQVKNDNALIKQLAPVIYSPFLNNYFTVTPAPVTVSPFVADSGIDATARYYTGGGSLANGQYIFATPRSSQSAVNIPATFSTVDGYSGPVTVINESRTVTAVNGVFSDVFAAGTTVHMYFIPPSSSPPPPVVTGGTIIPLPFARAHH